MSIITDAPRNVDVRIVDGMFLVSTVSCRFTFILVRRVGLGWNKHTQVCECDEVVCYAEQCVQFYRWYMLLLHICLFWGWGGGGGGKGKSSPVDTVARSARELGVSADMSIFYRRGYMLRRLFTVCLESAKYTW